MLILTRKEGQRIIIGGDIVITYLCINEYNQAVFGIDAPKDIIILRDELTTGPQSSEELLNLKK